VCAGVAALSAISGHRSLTNAALKLCRGGAGHDDWAIRGSDEAALSSLGLEASKVVGATIRS
jgi:hypothetical protein